VTNKKKPELRAIDAPVSGKGLDARMYLQRGKRAKILSSMKDPTAKTLTE
jgi:hypothetical protein